MRQERRIHELSLGMCEAGKMKLRVCGEDAAGEGEKAIDLCWTDGGR